MVIGKTGLIAAGAQDLLDDQVSYRDQQGNTMKFIIAIDPGTSTQAWGVAVPDLPGCFSAGDTLDEAMKNACEAIDLHVSTLIEDGDPIPAASSMEALQADPEYRGWVWAVVDVPVEKYFGPAE